MGFFKRRGQQQQAVEGSGEQRQRGPSDPDIMRLYAPLAKETDDLVLELVRIQNAIKAGDRKDITEAVGDAVFRVRRSSHQHAVEKTFAKPPQGSREQSQSWSSFDGWFKRYAEKEYGFDPDTNQPSAWVQEHGDTEDWVHHAIYLVLPGQILKHNYQVEWCEFVGVQPADVITNKGRFKDLVYEPALEKMATERPTEKDFLEAGKTKQDYLMAVADYEEATRKFRPNSQNRTEIEIWLGLRKRQPRQGAQGSDVQSPPPVVKSLKEVLTEELSELREKLQGLRDKMGKDAVAGVAAEELGKLAMSIAGTEKDIREKQGQLDKLTKAPAQPVKSRLEQIKDIVVLEPVVTTPITTVGKNAREQLNERLEAAKTHKADALKAEDGKALDEAKAEIARIGTELKKLDETEKAAADAAKKAVTPKAEKKREKKDTAAKPAADAVVEPVEAKVAGTTPPVLETDGKVTANDPKGALALQIAEAAKIGNIELIKELRETMKMLD